MQLQRTDGKLTKRDLLTARALKAAPFAGFVAATLPFPVLFFILYLLSTEGAAFYMLLTLSSLGLGAIVGLILALGLFLYRRSWERGLRERLAMDGITADELPFFRGELKTSERLALRRIESRNAALADAYRETLAARLTATRVLHRAKKELVKVNGRLARARQLRNADTQDLQADLEGDLRRVEEIKNRAEMHLGQAEAQLQMIDATSSRAELNSVTDFAMQRLSSTVDQPPLALQAARLEEAARQQVQAIMRDAEEADRSSH